jgi:hypothetical protein
MEEGFREDAGEIPAQQNAEDAIIFQRAEQRVAQPADANQCNKEEEFVRAKRDLLQMFEVVSQFDIFLEDYAQFTAEFDEKIQIYMLIDKLVLALSTAKIILCQHLAGERGAITHPGDLAKLDKCKETISNINGQIKEFSAKIVRFVKHAK